MHTPTTDLHRIATTAIIWREEADGARRYLITKRALHKKNWPGKWTVPGGGMEPSDYLDTEAAYQNSESPQWYHVIERTLAREVAEEVGLEIDEPTFLHDVVFIQPDGIPSIVFSYYCAYKGGEVALDEDATEHAWIAAREVGDYELIQGIDDEIQMVEERLTKSHD